MKNRLSKMGKSGKWMLILLAACGVTSSCKDDYTLDDHKPSWLNSSIYENLESEGNYKNYLRLIADPDVNPSTARPLTEVLSRTGSKTVFAANDEAWQAFYEHNKTLPASNPWSNATCYENLSTAQKNLLIHTSMLNNAIVMENLSSEQVGNEMARGRIMRRYTDVNTTDSITWLPAEELPTNYTEDPIEIDNWARFRAENGGKGLYLVMDSVPSMMVHFTNEFLKANNITDDDFTYFLGRERKTADVHIYDALLTKKDVVSQNGYVNQTEKVLTPLPNMAEALRLNPETQIFSHMLDRWSAPFYNVGVTQAYKQYMHSRNLPWTDQDSIFTKRYFSNHSFPGSKSALTPFWVRSDGETFGDSNGRGSAYSMLKFDPGWNGYYRTQSAPGYDMAAMYVPNDATLWEYFTEGGGGWSLIQTYCTFAGTPNEKPYIRPTTKEDLYKQIDQIPVSTLKSLINNIMFDNFTGSVPSKMSKLKDDANENLFTPDDKQHIVGSILANNGAIYLTDKVYGPADFTSVAAPAFISLTNTIMKWAIYNDNDKQMGLNYYAYLKAMQSRFALFLPSNKGLAYYYDPVSFNIKINEQGTSSPRVIKFGYDEKNKGMPITNVAYRYNPATGTIGKKLGTTWVLDKNEINTSTGTGGEVFNRLKDILETHTIVLEDADEINTDIDQYYLTKNGSAVKVTRANDANGNPHIVKVQGGFQLENEEAGIVGNLSSDNEDYTEVHGVDFAVVTDESALSNGVTYILDSPIIPASRSVYYYLTEDGIADGSANDKQSPYYHEFYKLCTTPTNYKEILDSCKLVDPKLDVTKKTREYEKYQVFKDLKGPDYNVNFFNNYNYTLFIPTDDAIRDAIAHGLPTWEAIAAEFESKKIEDPEGGKPHYELTEEDRAIMGAKITYLTNFIRYHFADNSVFVDNSNFESTEYITSSFDKDKGLFNKLKVMRQGGTLMVQDIYSQKNGGWTNVSGRYNVMSREISCSKKPDGSSMSAVRIDGTSFVVIHQIPSVLYHTVEGSSYNDLWKDTQSARRYMKRYAIPANVNRK